LPETHAAPAPFVRQALRLLEADRRELALLALAVWRAGAGFRPAAPAAAFRAPWFYPDPPPP
jgi:hypothetical protein